MRKIVSLDAGITSSIARHCAETPGVEFGGVMITGPLGSYATGAGPGARMGATELVWEATYIAGCLEVAAGLGCEFIGRWHKHTTPIILASAEDRASAEHLRRSIGGDVIDVIVACDGPTPIAWAAYLCTDAGYERVELELPGET